MIYTLDTAVCGSNLLTTYLLTNGGECEDLYNGRVLALNLVGRTVSVERKEDPYTFKEILFGENHLMET